MGQGTWVGKGRRPPSPCAWSKVRLGWVDVRTVTETTRGIALAPVGRRPEVVRIPMPGGPPEEFRDRIRNDSEKWKKVVKSANIRIAK